MKFPWAPSLILCISACHDVTGPATVDVREWVTEQVGVALDARGQFVFPAPPYVTTDSSIGATRATELAKAFVATNSASATFRMLVEAQHGGPVAFDELSPGNRVEFAESAYEVADAATPRLRRDTGPAHVVRFAQHGSPVLTVTVSVFASDFSVQDGKLVAPPTSGGEFQVWGSDRVEGAGWARPLGPERAVEVAARATGARAAAVPSLLRPSREYSMEFARWRVQLDREVSCRGRETGRTYRTRVLFVGLSLTGSPASTATLFVPVDSQPAFDTTSAGILTRRPAQPLRFEAVTVSK